MSQMHSQNVNLMPFVQERWDKSSRTHGNSAENSNDSRHGKVEPMLSFNEPPQANDNRDSQMFMKLRNKNNKFIER